MNVIFVVADDLGYADLGCYGGRAAEFGAVSPHIDRLAREGIRFTQGYANSPVCSPTRFALMTGRWQYRLRGAAEEPINSRSRGNPHLGLPPDHPTMPSMLRAAGWRTALIGKWHLGYPPHFGPRLSGYETFYLHLSAFGPGIRAGVRVDQGQTIGLVGATGLATGPHLHYGLTRNGVFVNPLREHMNQPPGEPVPASAMAAFETERDRALAQLATTPTATN